MDMPMSPDSGSMSTMSMVFTNVHSTPLFSSQWAPTSPGGYAGTCIFLVVLAVLARLLGAGRSVLERRWRDRALRRRYVVVAGASTDVDWVSGGDRTDMAASSSAPTTDEKRWANARVGEARLPRRRDSDTPSEEATLTTRGVDERVRVVRSAGRGWEVPPWRLSTDLPRACVFVVQAGVGYLLMLAVMTLNVGYFLSVLAGLFLGELAVGRYSTADDGHH